MLLTIQAALADDAAVEAYLESRLEMGRLQIATVSSNQYGTPTNFDIFDLWIVFDGDEPLSTRNFAKAVGDEGTLRELDRRRLVNGVVGGGLTVGGLGLAAGGLAMLANEPHSDTGIVLAVTGAVVGTSGLYTLYGGVSHRYYMHNFYEKADAAARVDAYNAARMQELGVTPEQVRAWVDAHSSRTVTVTPWVAANGAGLSGTF